MMPSHPVLWGIARYRSAQFVIISYFFGRQFATSGVSAVKISSLRRCRLLFKAVLHAKRAYDEAVGDKWSIDMSNN